MAETKTRPSKSNTVLQSISWGHARKHTHTYTLMHRYTQSHTHIHSRSYMYAMAKK